MKTLDYDLVAVGGGTAGLVSAAGAAYLGAKPALIERHALGGDCLWTGCVPSKALIASARLAQAMRDAERLGLHGQAPAFAFETVMERMRSARARVAHHDDPERFRAMGVDVHFGSAHFVGPDTVEVEGVGRIRSRRIVLATGARPVVPPIPGLDTVDPLTHESVFDLDVLPGRLLILGAGPIGLEFAQVFRRLGSQVTVLEMAEQILPREDADVATAVLDALRAEGIELELGAQVTAAATRDGAVALSTHDGRTFEGDRVLVAVGRRPATDELELDRAGIERNGAAVRVDSTLRTSNRRVWAAGDVTGGLQFTHVADYMAKTVLRNAIFPGSSKVDYSTVPWVTFTDPEVAHVGLGQEEAEARGARTFTYPFDDLDRAIADGETAGLVKVSADRKGRVLGASIVGHGAGDLLQPFVLAMKHGLRLSDISNSIFPYPTRVEGVKRAADAFQRARLEGRAGRLLRKVVQWLT